MNSIVIIKILWGGEGEASTALGKFNNGYSSKHIKKENTWLDLHLRVSTLGHFQLTNRKKKNTRGNS